MSGVQRRPPTDFQVVASAHPRASGVEATIPAPALALQGDILLDGPYRVRGFNVMPRRYELLWIAGARGKPQVTGDIVNATAATREPADPNIELAGTNAVDADCDYSVEGGITLATHGASADTSILQPQQQTGISAWKTVTWGTDQETIWETLIRTAGNITATTIHAGLKLTNIDTVTTDNDQVMFRYQDTVNSGTWGCVVSIANVDITFDTLLTVAINTSYHLKITIDPDRLARFFINGHLAYTSTALTDATDLIPFIGIKSGAVAVKSMRVLGQAISRKIA